MNEEFQSRESFHLLFLFNLSLRLKGRLYAVKGGMCLRLFHHSPRLSEDMDLDIAQIPTTTLAHAVDQILHASSFHSQLEAKGLALTQMSSPKQTPTTQRWKIQLSREGRKLSTRLEFSRRRKTFNPLRGTPDITLLSQHGIMSFVTQYYDRNEMIAQKLLALAEPRRLAARDLFDLHHLLKESGTKPSIHLEKPLEKEILANAKEKISTISFATFKAEVIPFLPEDLAEHYGHRESYQNRVDELIHLL